MRSHLTDIHGEALPVTIEVLMETVDELPEPALLFDTALRLIYVNTAAEPLFDTAGHWDPEWRDPGDAPCLAPLLLGRACTGRGACEGCLLHETLRRSLARGASLAPMTLEGAVLRGGQILELRFELTARVVTADGIAGLVVTLREVDSPTMTTSLVGAASQRGL